MVNFKKENIQSLLNKCLTGEYKVEGWEHPLGFGHIKIHSGNPEEKIRLHFWDKKMGESVLGELDRIHNHAFDFTSYVLKGGLMEKFYKMTINSFGKDRIWEIENKGDHSTLRRTGIRCDKTPSEKIYHNAGEVYNVKAGDFHDTISTSDDTVTLVFETSRPEVTSLMICSEEINEIERGMWPIIEKKDIVRIINLALS